ncbi:MAG: MlaD family protein [Paracoccus sp. (in: a-proteobacteria)]
METKANYVLIGAFTVAGFLGILVFLMWFAKLQLNRQFEHYDVFFNEVTGLSISSPVLFAGLNVGQVTDIQLAPDRSEAVRVRLELAQHVPVRTDSRASVETSAVTGVSTVLITPGSETAPLLRDVTVEGVPEIQSSRSALQALGRDAPQLLAQLRVLADQLSRLLDNENLDRVSAILANVEGASAKLDTTMDSVGRAADDLAGFGDKLDQLGDAAETALASFGSASDQAKTTLAGVDRYVTDDLTPLTGSLQGTVDLVRGDLGPALTAAAEAFDSLRAMLDSLRAPVQSFAQQGLPQFSHLAVDARAMVDNINRLVSNLGRNPSQILKGRPTPEFRR